MLSSNSILKESLADIQHGVKTDCVEKSLTIL